MTLSILIVSNVEVVRDGLRSVLLRHGDVSVVGAVDVYNARVQSEQLHAEVILFDAGRRDSFDLLRALVTSAPHSKVVAFGVRETEDDIIALAAAGTAGYIRDNVKSGDVVRVLQQLLADELSCSPRAAASLYRRVATLSQPAASPIAPRAPLATRALPLSRRELQIARLIDCGLTNKEIARQLGIEAATVKNHIHNLCEKLHVHRRGEAIARIRALLTGQAATLPPPALAPATDSLPAPKRAGDQNPAARNGGQLGHPWADVGQLGGIATTSAPSEVAAANVKF